MHRIIQKIFLTCLVCFTFDSIHAEIINSKGYFTTSDATLNHVWNQAHSANSFYKTQLQSESFSAYWPDPVPTIRAHFYLDSDATYGRSIISRSFSPSEYKEDSPEIYSLHWPVLLQQYHQFTGNDDYAQSLVESSLPVVMAHFEASISNKGLIISDVALPESMRLGLDTTNDLTIEDTLTNLFYYNALTATVLLHKSLGLESNSWQKKAESLKESILTHFKRGDSALLVDHLNSKHISIPVNALAVCVGILDNKNDVINLIRKNGMICDPLFVPYIIEACFIAGEHQLATDLMSFIEDFSTNPAPIYLIPNYIFGVLPHETGWATINITPILGPIITEATLQVSIPTGRVRLTYDAEKGINITTPIPNNVLVNGPESLSIVIKKQWSHTMPEKLSAEARVTLDAKEPKAFAGDTPYIWVSIDEQILRIIHEDKVEYQTRCASAEKGIGSIMNSLQTPLGWHTITKKIGKDAPWGQVFRSRRPTREIWQPGEDTKEDLVLSRVLLLSGDEPGLNKGGNVDSFARNIYIHGTNDEAKIGTPSSHGCIRMLNDDVIEMFSGIQEGMKVLITGTES
jgi:hypothetical protein